MRRTGVPADAGRRPPSGDLARLLETEQRLEEALAAARREAGRLVEEARRAGEDAEQALRDQVVAVSASLAAAIAAERDREMAAIEEESRRRVAASEDMTDALVLELARYVVARVIGGES